MPFRVIFFQNSLFPLIDAVHNSFFFILLINFHSFVPVRFCKYRFKFLVIDCELLLVWMVCYSRARHQTARIIKIGCILWVLIGLVAHWGYSYLVSGVLEPQYSGLSLKLILDLVLVVRGHVSMFINLDSSRSNLIYCLIPASDVFKLRPSSLHLFSQIQRLLASQIDLFLIRNILVLVNL